MLSRVIDKLEFIDKCQLTDKCEAQIYSKIVHNTQNLLSISSIIRIVYNFNTLYLVYRYECREIFRLIMKTIDL